MIAVKFSEDDKYGCPNCGCDRWIRDSSYCGNQVGGTCKSCGIHYMIVHDSLTQDDISISYGTGRKDKDGKDIFEKPIIIPHPRKGIPKWHYETPDIRPENGEYWSSRGIGYDLSGFVKSKQAGERLLEMVKEVLGVDKPKSWLDYRDSEPDWIQFKFQKEEFDLEKLDKMASENNDIITKDILLKCIHADCI